MFLIIAVRQGLSRPRQVVIGLKKGIVMDLPARRLRFTTRAARAARHRWPPRCARR